jgi:hypothetical protein
MAGVQEEFGNRLQEGYMANLGEALFRSFTLSHTPLVLPFPTLPGAHTYPSYSLLVLRTRTDNQNKHNQQYQNTNPFVKSLNLVD